MRNLKSSKGFWQEMQWYDTCYSMVKVTARVLEEKQIHGIPAYFFPMPVRHATDLWFLGS